MAFTALTDPFQVSFEKDGVLYEAIVTYAKQDDCSEYFFDVHVKRPEGLEPIRLKEKPTLNPDYDYMVWVDDKDRINVIYQQLGNEIEQELKKLGVFLIDAPVSNHQQQSDDLNTQED